MKRTILTAAAVLATLPTFAQAPNYDTARHCTEFAKGSQFAENQCCHEEADARRELDKTRVSQEVWTYCQEKIRIEQSYVLFLGCTLNEAEARAAQEKIASAGVSSTNVPPSNIGAKPADITVKRSESTTVIRRSKAAIENRAGH